MVLWGINAMDAVLDILSMAQPPPPTSAKMAMV